MKGGIPLNGKPGCVIKRATNNASYMAPLCLRCLHQFMLPDTWPQLAFTHSLLICTGFGEIRPVCTCSFKLSPCA